MSFKPEFKKIEKLAKELHEKYPEVKPKLTFNFPLSIRRKNFLNHIINKKLSTSDLCSFLDIKNNDYTEKIIALSCIGNIAPILDENQDKYVDLMMSYWSTFYLDILNLISFDQKKDIIIKALLDVKDNKKAKKILELMQKDTYRLVHIEPWELKKFDNNNFPKTTPSKNKKNNREFLIANQKSIFANPYTKEIMKNISSLQEISKTLEKEFDTYVGIIIVGSLWKGYFQPTSDIDWSILYKDQESGKDSCSIRPRFIELAKNRNINLCSKNTSIDTLCTDELISESEDYDKLNGIILFNGLFFGNQKELVTIQKQYLDNTNERHWEQIESLLVSHISEINMSKYRRLNLSINELRPILLLTKLPPSLSEVRNIINNRYNRLVLNK